jgi:hypothetical protein
MGLVLKKREGETWREAALRQASRYSMQSEVAEFYDRFIAEGDTEDRAAWAACLEWDVLDYIRPKPKSERVSN